MQKAAAVRAYGEGEQQQAGMAVSWHQEGARECGGGVEWRAWRSVEAAAGPIAMCDSARGDGTFGDVPVGCGKAQQGQKHLGRGFRSRSHSGSAEGGWGAARRAR